MAGHDEPERPDPASMTFEAAAAELETIIARIEGGDSGLAESLTELRRGEALVKRCRAVIEAAEQELEQIRADETADATPEQGGEGS